MKKRKDGRWQKKKTIEGESVFFYSNAETEKQAIKDIENQMITYEEKRHQEKHNFKILAEKMIDFQSNSVGYKTIECYTVALKHLSGFYKYDIEEITPAMVQGLIDRMSKKEGYSFSSVSKVKITFGLIIDYAIVHENLSLNNYIRSIKIPKGTKKGKVTSPPDFIREIIIENAENVEFGMWAMCLLCLGLRRGELAGLQKRKIDFAKNTILIDDAVEFIANRPHLKGVPKTDDSIGLIPILNIIRPYLVRMCEHLEPDDFLFGGKSPLTETQIKKKWKKYCNSIGHTFNGHQLRHAYAKLLYEAGVDPKTMQRLLRHADFSTTMNIYTDFSKEVTYKSIDMINKYLTTF